jgi:hypothetical protein
MDGWLPSHYGLVSSSCRVASARAAPRGADDGAGGPGGMG